jgi:hypothetical protein
LNQCMDKWLALIAFDGKYKRGDLMI